MKKTKLSKSPDLKIYMSRRHNERLVVFQYEADNEAGAGITITTHKKNCCIIDKMRMGWTTFSIGLTNQGLMDLHLILTNFIKENITEEEFQNWQNEISQ